MGATLSCDDDGVGRQRYLLSAAAIGAIAVLLGYGFVVRGLGLNHGLRSVYTIVAAVLLLVSRRAVRGVDRDDRPRVRWLIAAAIGGAAIACAAALLADPPLALRRLATKHFPGFTADLPDGRVQAGARTYAIGLYSVDIDPGHGVSVGWQVGDGGRDQPETLVRGTKAAWPRAPRAAREITGADRATVALDLEDGRTIFVTTLPCDGRGIYILSLGLPESMHARVVHSVVCTPEPHGNEEVPVALDLRGFVLVENKDGHLIYDSAGKAKLIALTTPAAEDAATFRTTASPVLANQGLTDVRLEPQGPEQYAFTATGAVGAGRGVIRNLRCGARGVLVMGFAIDRAAAPQLASAIASARCK